MSNEDILRMCLVIMETKTKLALCKTAVHLSCKAADAIHWHAKKFSGGRCDSLACKEIFLLKTKI